MIDKWFSDSTDDFLVVMITEQLAIVFELILDCCIFMPQVFDQYRDSENWLYSSSNRKRNFQ